MKYEKPDLLNFSSNPHYGICGDGSAPGGALGDTCTDGADVNNCGGGSYVGNDSLCISGTSADQTGDCSDGASTPGICTNGSTDSGPIPASCNTGFDPSQSAACNSGGSN